MTTDEMNGLPPDHAGEAGREVERTGRLLRSATPEPAFRDGFADRTMARLAASRAAASVTVAPTPPSLLRAYAIQRNFRLLAAAATLAIVALGVHNTVVARSDDASVLDAAIGLEPVSAVSVLTYPSDLLP
ncbi:MAG: hypothetical protein IT355_05650 [Gemmatimonadaceae bacterium]|nr:hypothetical protein [Gemmatimonadaceae bacterium]